MRLFKICANLGLLLCAACSAAGQLPSPSLPPPPTAPLAAAAPIITASPGMPVEAPTLSASPTTPVALASAYPARPVCIPPGAVIETGQAIRVIDGDTIEVLRDGQAFPLRYIGIDSPEINHPQKGKEVFGPEAAALNQALVLGRQVVMVKDVSDTDSFGRLLRYVFLDSLEGPFVNVELVRAGFARASRYPPDVACADIFQAVEEEAQAAQLALWSPLVATAAVLSALAPSVPAASASALPVRGLTTELLTPSSQPSAGATLTPPGIVISTIFYNGSAGDKEPDEYVEIRNNGSEPIQLAGWALADKAHHRFTFAEFELAPGQVCRIYTNQDHSEWCGFNYRYAETAIWNNSGDCAYLTDANGQPVAEYCYRPKP